MVTIVKSKKLRVDADYEPPMKVGFGIDSASVPNAKIVLGYTTAVAGSKNQRHYHANTAAAQYFIKGRGKVIVGPDHAKQEFIVEAGDFMYVPRGEIHGGETLEDTALVFCYTDVSSKEEAGTIYIDPPPKK